MTYLLSQIFISLLLAAVAGGAIGWIARGLKAHRRESELNGLVNRHASARAQAQQERQMIADDFDEMQLGLESCIGELQVENRKLPELHDNLQKSQQLVQQMMKSHASEIAETSQHNEQLKLELDNLRVQQKNDHSEIAALRKTNAELGGTLGGSLGSSNRQFESDPAPAKESTAMQQTEIPADQTEQKNLTTAAADTSFKREHGRAHHSAETPFDNDDLSDVIVESADRAAVTQAELLELESEIEEMRGYNRDVGSATEHDRLTATNLPAAAADTPDTIARTAKPKITAGATAAAATVASSVTSNAASTATLAGSQNDAASADEYSSTHQALSADPETVAELREHFSAGGDPEATDDLQTIHGIGPVMEKTLNDIGITNYHQIAELTRREIEDIAEILEIFPGRIERDNWIGSARKLAGDASLQTADNKQNDKRYEARKEAKNPLRQAKEEIS